VRPWPAVRYVVVTGLWAGVVGACASIPDIDFIPNDAATGDDRSLYVSPDAATGNPPIFAPDAGDDGGSITGDSGAPAPDAIAPSDAGTSPDAAPLKDAGTWCLPSGAPASATCCANGDPCIGQGCTVCTKCQCTAGQYCCASVNGGGKVKPVCSADPSTCSM
jgi:hypothetical protein